MNAAITRREGWNPIESAPRDGTTVLLLYPNGRVELGRWEHTTRTTNGKTVSERKGWTSKSIMFPFDREPIEPVFYADVPALPEGFRHG